MAVAAMVMVAMAAVVMVTEVAEAFHTLARRSLCSQSPERSH